jgi:hypothetical protein
VSHITQRITSKGATMETPITTLTVEGRTFSVYTLASYNTPYFYVKELGSREHRGFVAALLGAP